MKKLIAQRPIQYMGRTYERGEAIPAQVQPHLFERFYRADASRGEQSGFGLGLSIAGAIAREHKGALRAESGGGVTRFVFTMPLKR